jgi:hypothetical protein
VTISEHGYAVYKGMLESGREAMPAADRIVYEARLASERRPEQRDAARSLAKQFEGVREVKIAERAKALSGNGWPKEFIYLGVRALLLELELNECLERIKVLEKKIHDMLHPPELHAAPNDRQFQVQ